MYRKNIFITMMSNYSEVLKNNESAINSNNVATQKQDIFNKSLQASINKLKDAWDSLYLTVINSEAWKKALSAITGLVNGFNSLSKTIGFLPATITAIVVGFSLMGKINIANSIGASVDVVRAKMLALRMEQTFYANNTVSTNATTNVFKGTMLALRDSTVVATIATTALNAAITLGLSVAIYGIITAITRWKDEQAKLKEQMKLATDAIHDITDASNEFHKSLNPNAVDKETSALLRLKDALNYTEAIKNISALREKLKGLQNGSIGVVIHGNVVTSTAEIAGVQKQIDAYQKSIDAYDKQSAKVGEDVAQATEIKKKKEYNDQIKAAEDLANAKSKIKKTQTGVAKQATTQANSLPELPNLDNLDRTEKYLRLISQSEANIANLQSSMNDEEDYVKKNNYLEKINKELEHQQGLLLSIQNVNKQNLANDKKILNKDSKDFKYDKEGNLTNSYDVIKKEQEKYIALKQNALNLEKKVQADAKVNTKGMSKDELKAHNALVAEDNKNTKEASALALAKKKQVDALVMAVKNYNDTLDKTIKGDSDIANLNKTISKNKVEETKNINTANRAFLTSENKKSDIAKNTLDLAKDANTNVLQSENDYIATLEQSNSVLENKMKTLDKTSDIYAEYTQKIQENNKAINDTKLEKLQNTFDAVEKSASGFDDTITELQNRLSNTDDNDFDMRQRIITDEIAKTTFKIEGYNRAISDIESTTDPVIKSTKAYQDGMSNLKKEVTDAKYALNGYNNELTDNAQKQHDFALSLAKDVASAQKAEDEKKITSAEKQLELDKTASELAIKKIQDKIDAQDLANELADSAIEKAKLLQDITDAQVISEDEKTQSLQKQKDIQQAQLDLTKQQQALDSIKNERNTRIYREGQGFVWEANPKAVADAQEALNKAQEDLKSKQDDFTQWSTENNQKRLDSLKQAQDNYNRWELEQTRKHDRELLQNQIDAEKKSIDEKQKNFDLLKQQFEAMWNDVETISKNLLATYGNSIDSAITVLQSKLATLNSLNIGAVAIPSSLSDVVAPPSTITPPASTGGTPISTSGTSVLNSLVSGIIDTGKAVANISSNVLASISNNLDFSRGIIGGIIPTTPSFTSNNNGGNSTDNSITISNLTVQANNPSDMFSQLRNTARITSLRDV